VERAEESFRTTARRVQAERIGLAQLRDGTRLVRVGDAVPGELAAWRYGSELRQRRRRYWVELGFNAIATLAIGFPALLSQSRRKEVIGRVPATDSPNGRELLIRRYHLDGAEFRSGWGGDGGGGPGSRGAGEGDHGAGAAGLQGGGLTLHIPRRGLIVRRSPALELRGHATRAVLERALVGINQRGASPRELEGALEVLERAGSAEEYVGRLGSAVGRGDTVGRGDDADEPAVLRIRERLRTGHWRCEWSAPGRGAGSRAEAPRILALEMALHEAAERRALAGDTDFG
jgi:hypothetical protein